MPTLMMLVRKSSYNSSALLFISWCFPRRFLQSNQDKLSTEGQTRYISATVTTKKNEDNVDNVDNDNAVVITERVSNIIKNISDRQLGTKILHLYPEWGDLLGFVGKSRTLEFTGCCVNVGETQQAEEGNNHDSEDENSESSINDNRSISSSSIIK